MLPDVDEDLTPMAISEAADDFIRVPYRGR
jgi:hypothetical protein